MLRNMVCMPHCYLQSRLSPNQNPNFEHPLLKLEQHHYHHRRHHLFPLTILQINCFQSLVIELIYWDELGPLNPVEQTAFESYPMK